MYTRIHEAAFVSSPGTVVPPFYRGWEAPFRNHHCHTKQELREHVLGAIGQYSQKWFLKVVHGSTSKLLSMEKSQTHHFLLNLYIRFLQVLMVLSLFGLN